MLTPQDPRPRSLDRLIWVVLGVALVAIIAVGAREMARRPTTERLPVLGQLPGFRLSDATGKPLTADDLRGRIWIANFIFTRCSGICSVLSSAMETLQADLAAAGADDVRLVSFTVDPGFDTPQILLRYASRYHADPHRWSFVTGDGPTIYRLVQEGFKLAVAAAPPESNVPEGELITHSDRLVVIDEGLRVRAYHSISDPQAVAAALGDALSLRREPGR